MDYYHYLVLTLRLYKFKSPKKGETCAFLAGHTGGIGEELVQHIHITIPTNNLHKTFTSAHKNEKCNAFETSA